MAVAFDLARALDALDREPDRARALAHAALTDADIAGVRGEAREEVERWLAAHAAEGRAP